MSSAGSRPGRRSRHQDGGHSGGGERWLVSYADLITLLFALFVVLYATSQSDLKKFKEVSESVRKAFSSAPSSVALPGSGSAGTSISPTGEPTIAGTLQPSAWSGASVDSELPQILRLLEEAAELEPSVHRVPVLDGAEIRWIIQDSYSDGASRANEDFWPLLRRVARVLAKFPHRRIRWEGHADPAELRADSRALWQVSIDRAVWMNEFMKKEWKSMGAAQRGEAELAALGSSRALTLETSSWGRARNRRVELVILARSR